MKFSTEENQAVTQLLRNADFKVFLRALGAHMESLNERLVMQKLETGDLHNLQGQTRAMVLLVEAITDAPKKLIDSHNPKT